MKKGQKAGYCYLAIFFLLFLIILVHVAGCIPDCDFHPACCDYDPDLTEEEEDEEEDEEAGYEPGTNPTVTLPDADETEEGEEEEGEGGTEPTPVPPEGSNTPDIDDDEEDQGYEPTPVPPEGSNTPDIDDDEEDQGYEPGMGRSNPPEPSSPPASSPPPAPSASPSPSPSLTAGDNSEDDSVEVFVARWVCLSEKFRAYQTALDQFSKQEYCNAGCSNGQCNCAPNTCAGLSLASDSCGSFPNGCGGTVSCGCGANSECVNGSCECSPNTSCSVQAQCGIESDGCGGTVKCGSCEEGFECDEGWKKCVLGLLSDELELLNVKVFAFGNYAVVSWSSSVEASARVEFGLTEALGSVESGARDSTEHVVVLKGLPEETKYYYRVSSSALDSEAKSSVLSFVTGTDKEEFKILNIAVSPFSGIQREGQSFSFTAITTDSEPDSVEFEWDFGDGTVDSSGARAFHSFYGLGKEEEKSFTVKVKATDSDGLVSTAEKTVRVLKANFRAVVLKPEAFEKQSKESLLVVWIAFVDRENELIECEKIDFRVKFRNSIVEMECTESGYFAGSVMPWYGLRALELLELNATFDDGKTKHFLNTRFPVYFESVDVKVTPVFEGREFYLFDELDGSNFRFLLNESIVISPTELKAELVSGEKSEELSVESQGHGFRVSFDHVVSEKDFFEGLKLRFLGEDDKGNKIVDAQVVPLGYENPELTVVLLSPQNVEFAFGQSVEFKARILSVNYALVDRRIFVESRALGLFEEMELNFGTGEYSFEVELPSEDSGIEFVDFKFFGHGVVEGREIADLEFMEISLSDSLGIEMIAPKESPDKTRVWGNSLNEVKIMVFQANGLLFENKELEAVIEVDGVPEVVVLNFNNSTGEYFAVLSEPIGLGEHSVSVLLRGDFQGSKQVVCVVEQDLFVFQVLGLLIGSIVLLGVLMAVSFGYRNIVSERRFLLSEKARLIELRKSFKFEFYKRHISQSEFNSAMKQVNAGIKGINSILKNRGSWLYVGLMKTIYRSDDYRVLPERLQVALLVNRLAGRRGEYSRGDIRKGMAEEGYSAAVVERVTAKLYGEKPARKPFK